MDYFATKYDIDCPAGTKRAVLEDSIMQKGHPATAGSKMLESFISPFDATVVTRLVQAGVAIIGKTKMTEFGAGGLFTNSESGMWDSEPDSRMEYETATGNTHHSVPAHEAHEAHDTHEAHEMHEAHEVHEAHEDHESRNSVNGAVSAVADGAAEFGFCNDYTGAVRREAASRGLCYIQPTYGTVSRYGLIQAVPSMDRIGIVCKNPADGFHAIGVISGYDPKDGVMRTEPSNVENGWNGTEPSNVENGWNGTEPSNVENGWQSTGQCTKIGVPVNVFSKTAWSYTDLSGLGLAGNYEIVEFELKYFDIFTQVMQILCSAELSANMTRYDGIKFGYRAEGFDGLHELYTKSRTEAFGRDAKLAAILGAMVLSQGNYTRYYEKAMRVRRMIKDSLEFGRYDVIVMPTSCACAGGTIAANALPQLCGLPSLTMPVGGGGQSGGENSGKRHSGGISLIADQNREDILRNMS